MRIRDLKPSPFRATARPAIRLLLIVALASAYLLPPSPTAAVSIRPGDLLVADSQTGSDQRGAIIRVNPLTGAQTLVSGGGSFVDPSGIAFGQHGQLLVVDGNAFGGGGALFAVNPLTGAQTAISSGGAFVNPGGVAVGPGNQIFVADAGAFGGTGRIIRVNPNTGAQQQIASGGFLVDPFGIAVGPGPWLYVADHGFGGIIRVNRGSGAQSVIAGNFPEDGPYGIAVLPNGDLLATTVHHDGFSDTIARVIRVNPDTGEKIVIASGAPLFGLYGIALGPNGEILVPDADSFSLLGGIFRINPVTGQPNTISSFGLLSEPTSLAVAPSPVPEPTTLLLLGTTAAGLGLARWRQWRRQQQS